MRALRLLVISVLAAGCADEGGQQLIVLNISQPAEECVLTAAEGGDFNASGIVDTTGVTNHALTGYVMTPLIQNIGNSNDGELTAQRTVILQGARVDLVVGNHADGTPLLDASAIADLDALNALKFTALFSGSVSPDGGLAVLGFDAIPVATIAAIGEVLDTDELGLIQVEFTVFGETAAGNNVEADVFSFPVSVCNGCLFTNLGPCSGIADLEYVGAGGPCNVYQDEQAVCCETAGVLVCPAVADTSGG